MLGLAYDLNPSLRPVTTVRVVSRPRRPLAEKEREIREMLGLLDCSSLTNRGRERLVVLMEQFKNELLNILTTDELCCLNVPCRCQVKFVGSANGILSRQCDKGTGDVWEDVLVRNASGRGTRILPRSVRF